MKTTIEMAREAWAEAGEGWVADAWFDDRAKAFEAFAKLARADEREGTSMTKYEEQIQGMAQQNRGSVGMQEARPQPEQPDTDMAYTIALQRAIEWHCKSKVVPPDIAALCPHHAAKLNKALAQPKQEPVETYIHEYRSQPHPNDFGISKGHWWKAKQYADALYTTPPQRKPLTDEEELSNGLAMALHDAVLIRIGANDEATQQATARIDKLVNKYKIEAAHGIKENT